VRTVPAAERRSDTAVGMAHLNVLERGVRSRARGLSRWPGPIPR
jgi:hypothetical protein